MHDFEIDPQTNDKMRHTQAILHCITPRKPSRPEIIDGSCRLRIAKGCGLSVQKVKMVLKNGKQIQAMMKKMKNPRANLASPLGM
jgi:signal recognition particle subunit SRP54